MRLPIWDWTQPGADKYLYVRPNPTQFVVAHAADGIPELSILSVPDVAFRFPINVGTIGATGAVELIQLRRLPTDPVPGPCVDSHGATYAENSVVLGATGLFLCSASTWAKIASLERTW
jgi:hypothetical protein